MTTPTRSPESGRERAASTGMRGWRGLARRLTRGRRRRWALASLLSFWLAALALTLPLSVYADANSLASYGATASGWAIQPYILNDSFLNVPAADQSAPYVFVSMDNTPGARAKASYFFPGTAINAVPNTQNIPVTVPDGVEARYPGTGSTSGQVGLFNDGVATQAAAGSESAQASEGYALAQSGIANYQFAPTVLSALAPAPGVPALPSPPAVPTAPSGSASATPTATTGSGGGPAPTATPTTPVPTQCPIPPVCLPHADAAPMTMALLSAQVAQASPGLTPTQLPDNVEQQLSAALKAAEVANPTLLALAGGHAPTTDSSLPYAGADASSQAAARATDSGVGVTVVTRALHVELWQGLITFGAVESTLQAVAPASKARGSGTISTKISGATIAGIPVTIDETGVTVSDQSASADQIHALSNQLNAALASAGVHVVLASNTTKADAGFWEGAGAGVEVTAGLDPSGSGLPTSGVPATHVDFSIGKVSASIYALPSALSGSGDNGGGYGGGGGFCFFCGGSGGGDIPNSQTPPTTKHGGGKSFSLLGGLSGGEVLAMVFVIQGVSTAVVASMAGYTDPSNTETPATIEEESQ